MFKKSRDYLNRISKENKIVYLIPVLVILFAVTAFLSQSSKYLTFIGQEGIIKSGVYTPLGNDTATNDIQSFETLVGKKQDYYMIYSEWNYYNNSKKSAVAQQIINNGSIPVYTWEAHTCIYTTECAWTNYNLDDIINGDTKLLAGSNTTLTKYITDTANTLKGLSGTVYLRPLHEMNGSWYSWGAQGTNDSVKFKKAWAKIYDIFKAQGATNVKFVWCPNVNDVGSVAPYYPSYTDASGNKIEKVDITCMDGYNFGTTDKTAWRSFDATFASTYNEIKSLAPAKPLLIAEIGSVEGATGAKATWITDAYAKSRSSAYSLIEGVMWFNSTDNNFNFKIDTTTSSIDAFKKAIVNSLIDTTSPVVSVSTPLNGATVSGSTVGINSSATDTSGINKIEVYVDNVLKGNALSSTYNYSWNSSEVSNGAHGIVVKAYDKAGNVGSKSLSVNVSNSTVTTVNYKTTTFTGRFSRGQISKTFTLDVPKPGKITSKLVWGRGNLDLEVLDKNGVLIGASRTANSAETVSFDITSAGTFQFKAISDGRTRTDYNIEVIHPY